MLDLSLRALPRELFREARLAGTIGLTAATVGVALGIISQLSGYEIVSLPVQKGIEQSPSLTPTPNEDNDIEKANLLVATKETLTNQAVIHALGLPMLLAAEAGSEISFSTLASPRPNFKLEKKESLALYTARIWLADPGYSRANTAHGQLILGDQIDGNRTNLVTTSGRLFSYGYSADPGHHFGYSVNSKEITFELLQNFRMSNEAKLSPTIESSSLYRMYRMDTTAFSEITAVSGSSLRSSGMKF